MIWNVQNCAACYKLMKSSPLLRISRYDTTSVICLYGIFFIDGTFCNHLNNNMIIRNINTISIHKMDNFFNILFL